MSSFKIIIYSGYFLLLINNFLYFKSYRKYNIAFKILSFYLLFGLIVQVNSHYLSSLRKNNLFLSHFFFIGQFLVLSIFYLNTFTSKALKKTVFYGLILIILILIINIIYTEEYFYKWNVFEILLTSIPLLIYSFVFFIRNIDSTNKNFIFFNSGFFLYLICSTLLFSAGNLKSEIKNALWYFNAILYLAFQVLIFVDWYKNFRKNKSEILK